MNHIVNRSFRGFRSRYFASFFKPTFTSCSPCPSPILHQERTLASFISSNSWWALKSLTICRHYGSFRPILYQGRTLASFISSNSWCALRNLTIYRHYGSFRPILYQEQTLASFISSNSWWALKNLTICRHYGSFRPILYQERTLAAFISSNSWWASRNLTIYRHYGSSSSSSSSVRCVISQGKPKFEIFEIDPPKKNKFLSKKRLKLQRMKDKKKRRSANRTDPRRLTIKGSKRKGKFASVEERIKYKLEKTKIKEALLIERLERYEVPKLQGPMVKPIEITGEERFYMKKMAQKGSNYVPVGRRGVFGGVVLNMHMHWKNHETVKVICKPCKPGQVQDYANEIARLSGGIPIQIIGDDTIVFYRGKDYVQPEVMSPIDTLSKKKALEKSKYEQSLESARHFIAIAEKELELYRRHIALYGDPADHNNKTVVGGVSESTGERKQENVDSSSNEEPSANDDDYEDDDLSLSDTDCTDESSTELDYSDEET